MVTALLECIYYGIKFSEYPAKHFLYAGIMFDAFSYLLCLKLSMGGSLLNINFVVQLYMLPNSYGSQIYVFV